MRRGSMEASPGRARGKHSGLISILLFVAGEGPGEDRSHCCLGPHAIPSWQIQTWIHPPKRDLHFFSPAAAKLSGQQCRGGQGTGNLCSATLSLIQFLSARAYIVPSLWLLHKPSLGYAFNIHLFGIILWAGFERFYPLLGAISLLLIWFCALKLFTFLVMNKVPCFTWSQLLTSPWGLAQWSST